MFRFCPTGLVFCNWFMCSSLGVGQVCGIPVLSHRTGVLPAPVPVLSHRTGVLQPSIPRSSVPVVSHRTGFFFVPVVPPDWCLPLRMVSHASWVSLINSSSVHPNSARRLWHSVPVLSHRTGVLQLVRMCSFRFWFCPTGLVCCNGAPIRCCGRLFRFIPPDWCVATPPNLACCSGFIPPDWCLTPLFRFIPLGVLQPAAMSACGEGSRPGHSLGKSASGCVPVLSHRTGVCRSIFVPVSSHRTGVATHITALVLRNSVFRFCPTGLVFCNRAFPAVCSGFVPPDWCCNWKSYCCKT